MTKTLLIYILGIVLFQSCNNTSEEQAILPILLSSPHQKASCVYLTSDEKNNPVVSWCETDSTGKKYFYLSFFDAVAGKFSSAINVPIEQNASFHEEGMPKVAVKGDGSIVAVYETASPTKENEWAGYVRYMQTFDKGNTWSQPRCVHADTTSGSSRSFAAITRLSNGEIGACWLDAAFDYNKSGRPVKFASTDGNSGFKNEILIDSIACECCRTAISSDGGNVSIVYRDIINDSIRDVSLSKSINNGRSFSKPISFSGDNWNINGCPHNGPCVTTGGGVTYAAWYTGGAQKGVYYSELDKENKTLVKRQISANARNIQLCLLSGDTRMLAYNETIHEADSFYSKIVISKIENNKVFAKDITSLKAHAAYPVLKAFGTSKLLVAWSEQEKIYYALVDANQIKTEIQSSANPFQYDKADDIGITLANHTDPACGMYVDSDVQDTAMVNGKVIGFCSKYCKENFLKTPGKYKVE